MLYLTHKTRPVSKTRKVHIMKQLEYFIILYTHITTPVIIAWDPEKERLLDFLYRVIDCDCIETVPDPSGRLIIVDEEGLLRPAPQCNIGASMLRKCQMLYGNAVIAQHVIRDGEPDLGGWKSMQDIGLEAARVQEKIYEGLNHYISTL